MPLSGLGAGRDRGVNPEVTGEPAIPVGPGKHCWFAAIATIIYVVCEGRGTRVLFSACPRGGRVRWLPVPGACRDHPDLRHRRDRQLARVHRRRARRVRQLELLGLGHPHHRRPRLLAAGVLTGSQLARWFAVAMLALNAMDQVFFIPVYPFWSLMIIAVDVVALYEPCAYGSRANLAALNAGRKNVVEGRRSWCGLTSGPYRSRGPGSRRGLRADVAVDGAAPFAGDDPSAWSGGGRGRRSR